ncbi:MAG: hypothetical protein IJ157_00855 [Clostridia bacterium]|nr:hypothetical protein [Clostridia bacterium]
MDGKREIHMPVCIADQYAGFKQEIAAAWDSLHYRPETGAKAAGNGRAFCALTGRKRDFFAICHQQRGRKERIKSPYLSKCPDVAIFLQINASLFLHSIASIQHESRAAYNSGKKGPPPLAQRSGPGIMR